MKVMAIIQSKGGKFYGYYKQRGRFEGVDCV